MRHGRYVTFQLAEVAVPRNLFREIPRNLFREIPRRVDELRPRPAPAQAEGIDGEEKATREGGVWMARKMTEWHSRRGPSTEIMPTDGRKGDAVPVAVEK